MVGGMQTPEQPDFMCEKMVDKVRKLPDYIAINKPIPGKMRFKYGIFLKMILMCIFHKKIWHDLDVVRIIVIKTKENNFQNQGILFFVNLLITRF